MKVYAFQFGFVLDIILSDRCDRKHQTIVCLKARPTFTVAESNDSAGFEAIFNLASF